MALIATLVATVGVLAFAVSGAHPKWKAVAAIGLVASLVMQFVPTLGVPWLVPRLMQVAIAIWMLMALEVGGSLGVRADVLSSAPSKVTSARSEAPPDRPWLVPLLAVGVVAAIGGLVMHSRSMALKTQVCGDLGDLLCEKFVECGAFIPPANEVKWAEAHCESLRRDPTWCIDAMVTFEAAQVDACFASFATLDCRTLCMGDGETPCDVLFGGADPDEPPLQCDHPYQRIGG